LQRFFFARYGASGFATSNGFPWRNARIRSFVIGIMHLTDGVLGSVRREAQKD